MLASTSFFTCWTDALGGMLPEKFPTKKKTHSYKLLKNYGSASMDHQRSLSWMVNQVLWEARKHKSIYTEKE